MVQDQGPKFLPLIGEVAAILKEIVEIHQSAEHNKRICGIMYDRVSIAETAIKNLKPWHAVPR